MREKKQKFSGWFLVGGGLVFGHRRKHEELLRDVKRGIPCGAVSFGSEAEAERELEFMKSWNRWPLWTGEARPALRTWS